MEWQSGTGTEIKKNSFPNLECLFPEANKTLDNALDNEMQYE